MDSQSPRGKVISGVVKHCAKAQVPTMAIVGSLGDGYESLLQQGLTGVITTVNRCMALDEAFSQAETLYSDAAFRVFSMIKNLPGYKGRYNFSCILSSYLEAFSPLVYRIAKVIKSHLHRNGTAL